MSFLHPFFKTDFSYSFTDINGAAPNYLKQHRLGK